MYGAAYFYVRDRSGWLRKPTVTRDSIGVELGAAVALSGGPGIVGADGNKNGAGATCVLEY